MFPNSLKNNLFANTNKNTNNLFGDQQNFNKATSLFPQSQTDSNQNTFSLSQQSKSNPSPLLVFNKDSQNLFQNTENNKNPFSQKQSISFPFSSVSKNEIFQQKTQNKTETNNLVTSEMQNKAGQVNKKDEQKNENLSQQQKVENQNKPSLFTGVNLNLKFGSMNQNNKEEQPKKQSQPKIIEKNKQKKQVKQNIQQLSGLSLFMQSLQQSINLSNIQEKDHSISVPIISVDVIQKNQNIFTKLMQQLNLRGKDQQLKRESQIYLNLLKQENQQRFDQNENNELQIKQKRLNKDVIQNYEKKLNLNKQIQNVKRQNFVEIEKFKLYHQFLDNYILMKLKINQQNQQQNDQDQEFKQLNLKLLEFNKNLLQSKNYLLNNLDNQSGQILDEDFQQLTYKTREETENIQIQIQSLTSLKYILSQYNQRMKNQINSLTEQARDIEDIDQQVQQFQQNLSNKINLPQNINQKRLFNIIYKSIKHDINKIIPLAFSNNYKQNIKQLLAQTQTVKQQYERNKKNNQEKIRNIKLLKKKIQCFQLIKKQKSQENQLSENQNSFNVKMKQFKTNQSQLLNTYNSNGKTPYNNQGQQRVYLDKSSQIRQINKKQHLFSSETQKQLIKSVKQPPKFIHLDDSLTNSNYSLNLLNEYQVFKQNQYKLTNRQIIKFVLLIWFLILVISLFLTRVIPSFQEHSQSNISWFQLFKKQYQ